MRIVLIEWDDTSTRSGGWHYLDELDSVLGCFSLGVIVKEDEKQIVLSHSRNENRLNMETVAIPKGCIKRIRYLRIDNGYSPENR